VISTFTCDRFWQWCKWVLFVWFIDININLIGIYESHIIFNGFPPSFDSLRVILNYAPSQLRLRQWFVPEKPASFSPERIQYVIFIQPRLISMALSACHLNSSLLMNCSDEQHILRLIADFMRDSKTIWLLHFLDIYWSNQNGIIRDKIKIL
jgi:hypothetical protein